MAETIQVKTEIAQEIKEKNQEVKEVTTLDRVGKKLLQEEDAEDVKISLYTAPIRKG